MAEEKKDTTQVRVPTLLKEQWDKELAEANKGKWKATPLTDFLADKYLRKNGK